ncbi:MAG TPA: hypothetical protein VIU87_24160 [Mycobacterium sp.]
MIGWSVMIGCSVRGSDLAEVATGAADNYTAAAAAVLNATRTVLQHRDRNEVQPGRYTLCLDGE